MRVIWKATEKEQERRYQTAVEFKQAIGEAMLPDPPLWRRVWTWLKNHVVAVVFMSVVFFVVVVIVTLLIL